MYFKSPTRVKFYLCFEVVSDNKTTVAKIKSIPFLLSFPIYGILRLSRRQILFNKNFAQN